MSLHLPADQVDLSGEVSDGSGSSSSSEADANEETWSDWVSDSMGEQPCKSLFDDNTLPTVSAAHQYDLEKHGFNLEEVCGNLALDFHGRVRLINWIRKQNPPAADLIKLTGKESFFGEDEYLVPVIENDPLLLQSDTWSDDELEPSSQPAEHKDLTTANKRIHTLEAKLAQAERDLAEYQRLVKERLDVARLQDVITAGDKDTGDGEGTSKRDDDTYYFESYGANDIHAVMIQDKVRTSTYASFVLTNPTVFRDAVVLDVGCGTGILSLFAAQAGAKHVYAVDASGIARKAREIVKANGYEDVVTVIQGKVEDIKLPEDVKVDVIISEWMGYALLYESMLDSVLVARDRFLKPDGLLVPSECRIMLALCSGEEIRKERIEFWGDVYGFEMGAMAEGVWGEAVVDVVGSETVLSEPQCIKDLFLKDTHPRNLDFTAPFTLTSTSDRKTKVHALVLYFDTFFSIIPEPIPHSTTVSIVKPEGGGVADVFRLGRRPSRRSSQSAKSMVTSFSTGPKSQPTHWKQTLFLLREPIEVDEGTVVSGTFHLRKSRDNSRELDVEVHYTVRESEDAEMPKEVVVQVYKVR